MKWVILEYLPLQKFRKISLHILEFQNIPSIAYCFVNKILHCKFFRTATLTYFTFSGFKILFSPTVFVNIINQKSRII